MNTASIYSNRLELLLLSPQLLEALILQDRESIERNASFLPPDDLFSAESDDIEFFTLRRNQVNADAHWAPWLLRAILLRDNNAMIGTANFHGPPGINNTETPGAAELGYEIFPEYRNQGFATEVANVMIEWARREYGVSHFILSILPENPPSLRVAEKLRFVNTGQVRDGEIIFERRFL